MLLRLLALLAALVGIGALYAPRALLRASRSSPGRLFAEPEPPLEGADVFDVEQVLRDIAQEKDNRKATEAREKLEEKRKVLQKRSDRNYEKYWQEREAEGLPLKTKEAATIRSYYSVTNTNSSSSSSSLNSDNPEKQWDYQAVPVNPARGDGLAASAVGVGILAALILIKKQVGSRDEPRRKKERPVRGAINMPGIGPIYVD